jgi:hypothetical protein
MRKRHPILTGAATGGNTFRLPGRFRVRQGNGRRAGGDPGSLSRYAMLRILTRRFGTVPVDLSERLCAVQSAGRKYKGEILLCRPSWWLLRFRPDRRATKQNVAVIPQGGAGC